MLAASGWNMVMEFMGEAGQSPFAFPLAFLYIMPCYAAALGIQRMKDWGRWLAFPIAAFTLWGDARYILYRIRFGPAMDWDSYLLSPLGWFFVIVTLLTMLNALLAPFVTTYFLLFDKATVAAFRKPPAPDIAHPSDGTLKSGSNVRRPAVGWVLAGLAVGAIVLWRMPPPQCWAINNPPPADYQGQGQSLVFDLSQLSKPLCKVEPLPGVRLGTDLAYNTKLLGRHGVRFTIFNHEGTDPSPEAWAIEFQMMGKYPGNVGPVPVTARLIFHSTRLDGFSMVHSFENGDGAGLNTYNTIDNILTGALGASHDVNGRTKTSGSPGGPWFWEEHYGAAASLGRYRSHSAGEISINILVRY